jgi:hypothetical protein
MRKYEIERGLFSPFKIKNSSFSPPLKIRGEGWEEL